jgi:hypothetical protein
METKAQFTNPEDLRVTLSITMKLHEWRQVKKQLSSAHPSWELSSQIGSVVRQFDKTVIPQQDE